MRKRLPYMPLFVDDFLSSTKVAAMTPAEVGGYLMLLMNCWASGDVSIPADDSSLEMISRLGVGWKKSRNKLRACFTEHPTKEGFLTNSRLCEVWEQSQEISLKRAESGRRGGRPKKQNESNCFSFAFEKPAKLKAKNNHPKPPIVNTPLTPEGEGGGEVEFLVRKAAELGLFRAAQVVPEAVSRLGDSHVLELIEFYAANRASNDWTAARLNFRLGLPLMPAAEGWGTVEVAAVQQQEQDISFAGPILDAMTHEERLAMANTVSVTASVILRERGPSAVNDQAVRIPLMKHIAAKARA